MTSTFFLQEFLKQHTGEGIVILLTLEHEDLPEPFRGCTEPSGITSQGEDFVFYPFDIILPAEDPKRDPVIQLSIDNVDKRIGEAIEMIQTPIRVTTQITTFTYPDTIEGEWPVFELLDATYDEFSVIGALGLEDLTQEPFPAMSYDPSRYPALF